MTMTRLVALSDTHIRRGSRRRLPAAAYAHLENADLILHAGDVLVGDVLDELSGFAPVHAVLGNNDTELVGVLPEERRLEVGGLCIALVHDSGPRQGRESRMRRRFPDAAVVVFGHSHIPLDRPGRHGQRLFNPGSPTERRRQPHHTLGLLEIAEGHLLRHEIAVVDDP